METIHTGWLVKSPPDRPWKILKPKWKKQYFILSISQASTTLPGQCPAILDYYSSEKQSHKRGSIDLNSCDEVQTNVTSPPYEHVFTLRTKHKDHYRTYFLAAETEDDMNRWMQCLCSVLQLNDGSESSTEASMSELNALPSVVDERYVRVPQIHATSPVTLPPSTMGHGSSLRPSPCPVLPNEFNMPSTLVGEDGMEAYIYLDECYSGASAMAKTFSASDRIPQASSVGLQHHLRYNPPGSEDPMFDQRRIVYTNVPKSESCDSTDGQIHKVVGATSKNHSGNTTGEVEGRAVLSPEAAVEKENELNCTEVLLNREIDAPSYINLNDVGSLGQNAAACGYTNSAAISTGSKSCSSLNGRAVSNGSQACRSQRVENTFSILSSLPIASGSESHKDPNKVGIAVVDGKPFLSSGRTQSFKRNVIRSDVQLPIKKCSQGAETSSSDDDSSEDDSPLCRSYEVETAPGDPPPVPPPPKKTAHIQPRDAIQYLDLNLEQSSGAEKSPAINRSQHLPPPETNYNEIDWVRTKALLETKKDLESERHNSEKSAE